MYNWSKKERIEYKNWISAKFKSNEMNKQSEWKKVGSNNIMGGENEFDDSLIISKDQLSIPIFYLNKETETFEVDIIPGTQEVALTLAEIQQIMRGVQVVIVRGRVNGMLLKGLLEIEDCGDKINQIVAAKMVQITNEAKIESRFSKLAFGNIDAVIRDQGPNSLLCFMWKAQWIAFQGIDLTLSVVSKARIIRALIKALKISIDKEGNDSSLMDDRIIEGVQNQEINQEINSNLNIILIKMEIELDVSWDRGYFTLPNQDIIWTERKVSYIERLPKSVEELSTKENSQGEVKDIFQIVVTLYREDEVRELRNGIEAMVVGGFTKNNGSISMAERTNLAMIMAATGKEVETIINREGNIIAIGNVVLTFATIMREIGGKTRPEIVLVIITSDERTMKEIRDYQLELKEKSNEGRELVYLFGAAY